MAATIRVRREGKRRMPRKDVGFWSAEAKGYTNTVLGELEHEHRQRWENVLRSYMPAGDTLTILDAGCGPGYFSILLSQMGHTVTAIDFSEAMLKEAASNTARFGIPERVTILRMDAQAPVFPEESFDVIVSRNLTWMFADLKTVYDNWIRLLKPGGRLLVFDCNWYLYCFDSELFRQDEEDLQNALNMGYPYGDISRVYTPARPPEAAAFPLADKLRPEWDRRLLEDLSVSRVSVADNLPQDLRYGYYAVRYAHTPYFAVCAEK